MKSKAWENSTGKRFHAWQANRDASARLENKRRMEAARSRSANPFKGERENPQAGPERILDLQALARHLAQPLDPDVTPRLSGRLPPEAHPENVFNVWDIEPRLLDELRHALESGDSEKIKEARMYVRAGSWSTHGRTDDEVAAREARDMAAKMMAEHSTKKSMLAEEGFARDRRALETEMAGMERVIESLEAFDCDEKTESALRFVEDAVEEDWERLFEALEDEGAPWPKDAETAEALPGRAGDIAERIVAWRKIRDQLAFQRLYSHLCKIGQEHSATRAA